MTKFHPRYLVIVNAEHRLRSLLILLVLFVCIPLRAQGSENAIGAAVVFGAMIMATVLAGIIITLFYLFKRKPWQRIVVLVFGATLLGVGIWIGRQPGSNSDIEFLQSMLGGSGVVFLLIGSLFRARRKVRLA